MAAELRDSLKLNPRVRPGGFGAFDVIVDGRRVFAKSQTHRFPEPGEVTAIVRGLNAPK